MYDYVRFRSGTAVYKIDYSWGNLGEHRYKQVLKGDGTPVDSRYENYITVTDYDLVSGRYINVNKAEVEAKLEGSNMSKLYEWKDALGQQKFGTKLAVNSEGKWVMEVKGTSEVVSVDKSQVEEVIPHTIDIKFINGPNTTYSYLSPKGKYQVGELYLLSNQRGESIVTVVKVDTKAPQAHVEFTPTVQLVTKEVS